MFWAKQPQSGLILERQVGSTWRHEAKPDEDLCALQIALEPAGGSHY